MAYQFRELIRPGTNFEFIGRRRLFFWFSAFLMVGSIAMLFINARVRGSMLNWSIDFKGGTEMIVGLDKPVPANAVRKALGEGGWKGVDLSAYSFSEDSGKRQGYLLRFAEFGAVGPEQAAQIEDKFLQKFQQTKGVEKAKFSGDTLHIRSKQPFTQEELSAFFREVGLEMHPFTAEQLAEYATPLAGTGEYRYQASVYGIDRKVEQHLEAKLGVGVDIKQVDAVGAKAGAELRNDGIKSLLYAIALILLYIAFRFDFRYGPGTVASLLHDAIAVVGVFAVTWTEFSLTTVAALLTVIGYSMNDTVVVFDRIRENEHRLKDKKFDRVINISINETLSRTLLTSVTTFVVTLAMNILGTGLVKNFAFAMNVGIIVGTYSSIFIAAPILLWLHETYFARRPASDRSRRVAEPA